MLTPHVIFQNLRSDSILRFSYFLLSQKQKALKLNLKVRTVDEAFKQKHLQ